MKIYGVEFEIAENCIDRLNVQYVPGEGAIIPLMPNQIEGFYGYLVRNGCVRKSKIDMIYIFSVVACGEVLCVKYSDGTVSEIQDIGQVDFCQTIIHNNI